MSNYKNGKIYEVVSNGGSYIGSTTCSLCSRLTKHVSAFKRYERGVIRYITIFDVLSHTDYYIKLIEHYPCDNKNELLEREKYWIQNMKCVNKCLPILSAEDKQKYSREYHREYHQKMKDDPTYKKMRKIVRDKPENKIKKRDYERNRRQNDPEYNKKRKESYNRWIEANRDAYNTQRREKRALMKKQN